MYHSYHYIKIENYRGDGREKHGIHSRCSFRIADRI